LRTRLTSTPSTYTTLFRTNGLSLGAVYALLAVGYSIVYSILELINFAHGAVYMLGAYVTLTLMLSGVSFYVAFAIAALFCASMVDRKSTRVISSHAWLWYD